MHQKDWLSRCHWAKETRLRLSNKTEEQWYYRFDLTVQKLKDDDDHSYCQYRSEDHLSDNNGTHLLSQMSNDTFQPTTPVLNSWGFPSVINVGITRNQDLVQAMESLHLCFSVEETNKEI